MNHNLAEEEPADGPVTGGFQMMDPIEVDIGSDEEDLTEHQPVPCFGRTKALTDQASRAATGGYSKESQARGRADFSGGWSRSGERMRSSAHGKVELFDEYQDYSGWWRVVRLDYLT